MLDTLEKALALRGAELFASLSADALLPVAGLCVEVELEPGETLFFEGEIGDALYVIVRGSVSVERNERRIATLCQGECVGEMAALDWEPRSATVMAEETVTLIRLDRNDLMDLLADYPSLVDRLAHVLVDRIRTTNAALPAKQ